MSYTALGNIARMNEHIAALLVCAWHKVCRSVHLQQKLLQQRHCTVQAFLVVHVGQWHLKHQRQITLRLNIYPSCIYIELNGVFITGIRCIVLCDTVHQMDHQSRQKSCH